MRYFNRFKQKCYLWRLRAVARCSCVSIFGTTMRFNLWATIVFTLFFLFFVHIKLSRSTVAASAVLRRWISRGWECGMSSVWTPNNITQCNFAWHIIFLWCGPYRMSLFLAKCLVQCSLNYHENASRLNESNKTMGHLTLVGAFAWAGFDGKLNAKGRQSRIKEIRQS